MPLQRMKSTGRKPKCSKSRYHKIFLASYTLIMMVRISFTASKGSHYQYIPESNCEVDPKYATYDMRQFIMVTENIINFQRKLFSIIILNYLFSKSWACIFYTKNGPDLFENMILYDTRAVLSSEILPNMTTERLQWTSIIVRSNIFRPRRKVCGYSTKIISNDSPFLALRNITLERHPH